MPVSFEGFPRLLEPRALKPGRWFMATSAQGPVLCLMTDVEIDEKAVVLTFGLGKVDAIDVRPATLKSLSGPYTSVEDDLVFAPGEGAEKLRLVSPGRKPLPSGSLLRLGNGDMGIGFAEKLNGVFLIVSLASGQKVESYELVFDRWSLSLRRSGVTALVGQFRIAGWRT
jgi:hypothetical protein